VDERFCRAIKTRALVGARYRGGPARVLEIYLHGRTREDVETVLAYQREGSSHSGISSGWKTFVVSELSEVEVLDATSMHVRPDYDPEFTTFVHVHCGVKASDKGADPVG